MSAGNDHFPFVEPDPVRSSPQGGEGTVRESFRRIPMETEQGDFPVPAAGEGDPVAIDGRDPVASGRGKVGDGAPAVVRIDQQETVVHRIHQEAVVQEGDALGLTGRMGAVVADQTRFCAGKIVPGESAIGPDHRHVVLPVVFGEGVSIHLSAVQVAERKTDLRGIGNVEDPQNSAPASAGGKAAVVGKITQVAYVVRLESSDNSDRFVAVSMDAFSDAVRKIGVPTKASEAFFQTKVRNMIVISNVPSLRGGKSRKRANGSLKVAEYG